MFLVILEDTWATPPIENCGCAGPVYMVLGPPHPFLIKCVISALILIELAYDSQIFPKKKRNEKERNPSPSRFRPQDCIGSYVAIFNILSKVFIDLSEIWLVDGSEEHIMFCRC